MPSPAAVLHIKSLTKHYGKVKALSNLTLEVFRGEIFGYLGPNGAGKSTTIRLLLDFIRPTSGSAAIFGLDTRRESAAIRAQVGNLPGELVMWEHMTGWELVDYLGGLRGGVDRSYVGQLAERLGMDMNIRVKACSSGMKRKLGLIQAMMHKPALLILDEPTNGLDPLVQQTFYALIGEIKAQGRTVFMSSHNLAEVEHVCDRVGILRGGQLSAVERIDQLKRVHYRWMTLRFGESDRVFPNEFASIQGISDVSVEDGKVRFRLSGELDPVIKAAARHRVLDMDYEEPSLEDIFLDYYGEKQS
jgi:ABC-2 type transport system ATP-binding protein